MICFNCKRQIPDNVPVCPNCGSPISAEIQLPREIGFRRWQRWIFYAVLALMFVVMVGYIIKVYSDNTKLVDTITKTSLSLKQTQDALGQSQNTLNSTKQALTDKDNQLIQQQGQAAKLQQDLDTITNSQNTLQQKNTELQQLSDQATEMVKKDEQILARYESLKSSLGPINSGVYEALLKVGVPIANKDLAKIPVADFNFKGTDSDKDGLPDVLEQSLGTNPNKADSDGDSNSDKKEILSGYDPLAKAKKLPIDNNFVKSAKGKVLIQSGGHGEAWYVSVKDGKRYFLGVPAAGADVIKQLFEIGFPKASTTETTVSTTPVITTETTGTPATSSNPGGSVDNGF
ncbi:MAG: hypothetical protein WC516_02330 [Patescibacteria group bacterium]